MRSTRRRPDPGRQSALGKADRRNLQTSGHVYPSHTLDGRRVDVRHIRAVAIMSFLSKLFSKNQPKQRIRVCVECGMPIAEHKQWCSILRGQQEMERKAQAQKPAQST
jgi:hypothetical protein